MTDHLPEQQPPQDAPAPGPAPGASSWSTWRPEPTSPVTPPTEPTPLATAPATPSEPVPALETPPPGPPAVPGPPSGPNGALVFWGIAFVLVAAGVIAHQVNGFVPADLARLGPGVFVGVGVLLAVVGIVGSVRHRSPR